MKRKSHTELKNRKANRGLMNIPKFDKSHYTHHLVDIYTVTHHHIMKRKSYTELKNRKANRGLMIIINIPKFDVSLHSPPK